MNDDHQFPSGRDWDEYDWERFLQQQDRKTEKYMELLERYLDHPERDRLIAMEMGWDHLLDEPEGLDEEDSQLFEQLNSLLDEEEEIEDLDPAEDEEAEEFEQHPIFQASLSLTFWLEELFEEHDELRADPDAIKLAAYTAVSNAKLAAALSSLDTGEWGMTIAYLKRALSAVNTALGLCPSLRQVGGGEDGYETRARRRVFQIRHDIIALMGECREAWRRDQN